MIQFTPRIKIEKRVFTHDYRFTIMINQSEYDIFHSWKIIQTFKVLLNSWIQAESACKKKHCALL